MDLVRAGDADGAKFITDHYFALPVVRSGVQIDIHTAARLDLLERLVMLLEGDPEGVHQRDEVGLTPLHLAASDRIRSALVNQYGADPTAVDARFGATPAQWAVIDHRLDVAANLLEEEEVEDAVMLCALDMVEELKVCCPKNRDSESPSTWS
jgi:ankyrin repeat protein